MDLELQDKVTLVTGSSSGLGFAIAETFVGEGACVVLNGRNSETLQASVERLPNSQGVVADVRDNGDCNFLISETIRKHNRLDILVCNVGSGSSVPPGEENDQEWQRVIDENLFSTIRIIQAATPALTASNGVIVCISSICGIDVLGCPVAYAGTKAALNNFVANTARPLAKQGVRINALAPGNILFPGSVWARKLKENATTVQTMLNREVAMSRLGTAKEVADFCVFLASARCSFATGSTYVLDGGQIRS